MVGPRKVAPSILRVSTYEIVGGAEGNHRLVQTRDIMRIAVFGLGKLGSPLLAFLADAGHDVVGCDVMPQSVSLLNQGQAPVVETDLQVTLDRAKGHYSATTDPVVAM